jgi:hypothetical protein
MMKHDLSNKYAHITDMVKFSLVLESGIFGASGHFLGTAKGLGHIKN